jgi:two-component system, sensor histidine kinase PdtaS
LSCTNSTGTSESEHESSWLTSYHSRCAQKKQREFLMLEWQASLAREEALRKEMNDLLERQRERTKEFEHRLFNGLQLVASTLLLQRRGASFAAASQLTIAAARISAFGCVHRRIHLVDEETVEIKQHLQLLCDDLTSLLFHDAARKQLVVHGMNCEVLTVFAVPIGLIISELITNSVKHANTDIIVRFDSITPVNYSITVTDEGPGLPVNFDPFKSAGLGMQIVQALVKEIGGRLSFQTGANGRGTTVTFTFVLPDLESRRTRKHSTT